MNTIAAATPVLPDLKRQDNNIDAYQTLRRMIITFQMAPGELISENSLTETIGVPRAQIREALARLKEEGCVTVYPQRGTMVSLISSERINQAVFLRATLEQKILTQLCQTGLQPEQMAQLEKSLELQRKYYSQRKTDELLDEDIEMHKLFFKFCGQSTSWKAIEAINVDLMRSRHLKIRTYSFNDTVGNVHSWRNSLVEHRMILDLLRKRDAEGAGLMAWNHLTQAQYAADTLCKLYPHYFDPQAQGTLHIDF